jgi:hypothetical protein
MLEVGLFWVGIVLIATAIIMLFLDSFQSKRMWALVSLVLIVPLLIHMILNWSSLNIRKSFYILVIGLLATLVGVSGGALSQMSFLQDHETVQMLGDKIAPAENTPLPNQQQADTAALSVEENYDPLLTGSEYEHLETKEIVPEKINQVMRKAEPATRYEFVADDERLHAINKHVRIVMTDGSVVEGKLTEIIDDSLIVESEVNGGSLGLSYKDDLIQSVAVRLVDGEKLYVHDEAEQELVEESATDQQEPLREALLEQIDTPPTPDIHEIDVNNTAEQQPILGTQEISELPPEIVPESPVQDENEVLEKVEKIVDDTKLLDNVNGQ